GEGGRGVGPLRDRGGPLGLPIAELEQPIRDAADRERGQLVHAVASQLDEDAIRLVHQPLVVFIPGLPLFEDQDHTGVEGLLAHGPADQDGRLSSMEEDEGRQDLTGRLDHQVSPSQWGPVSRRLPEIRRGMDRGPGMLRSRGGHQAGGRRGVSLRVVLRPLDAWPVEQDEEGLHLREQRGGHDLEGPVRQGLGLGHGVPEPDELVGEVVDLGDAHQTITAQDLSRQDGEVVDELPEPEDGRVGGQGLGGGQSPMPEMPKGRPRVTEYCWSMWRIHHHSVCRSMHSRRGGAGLRCRG
ncbi:hypothetical protein Tdes44962_MAKER10306, partial [Teratosphaeria destructans]